jgi:hypothetical protein
MATTGTVRVRHDEEGWGVVLRVWPAGADPVDRRVGPPSTAYRSTLTLTVVDDEPR